MVPYNRYQRISEIGVENGLADPVRGEALHNGQPDLPYGL
jgi:hypothetical protein